MLILFGRVPCNLREQLAGVFVMCLHEVVPVCVRVCLKLSLCAGNSLKNSGHMSSPFMFYEGAGRGLVHSVS